MSGEQDPRRAAAERVAGIGRPGPKGDKGDQGDQGERGGQLHPRARRAIVYLCGLALLLAGANFYWSAHEANATGRKFCAVIEAATARPVPRPSDPAANPSREQNYQDYVKFVQLGVSLGCD